MRNPGEEQAEGKPKKVLHLVLQLALGGAESMVTLLARHLNPKKYEAHVWALDTGGENAARLQEAGMPVRVLEKGTGFNTGFLQSLRSDLARNRFDIIHAHNSPAARWSVAGTIGMRSRPRLIRTEHTFNRKSRIGYLLGHAITGPWFDAIIGVSESTTRAHVRSDPLWKSRYLTISNGIDMLGLKDSPAVDISARRKIDLPEHARILINLGNLRQPKGQDFLIKAFHRLAQKYPDLYLVMIGEGPLRTGLERLCREWNVEERVQFLGTRKDAEKLLPAADIFVQSSIREGMPVSVLEAARACRPIVATDVGGTSEFVLHGKTGILIPPGSVEELVSGIDRLLINPEEAKRLALASHTRFLERHTIETIARTTEQLYDRILG